MTKRIRLDDQLDVDYIAEILKRLTASVEDYLKFTFFKIFDEQESTLKKDFDRRCNNIIFNNHLEISKQLTKTVFLYKAEEFLLADLRETKFISYIYPKNSSLKFTPLFLQYFDKKNGIQHRLLQFMPNSNDLVQYVNDLNITEKYIGFCGEYSFVDADKATFRAEYFKNINSSRMIYYLPYCDCFLNNLINMIASYFPHNTKTVLEDLGNYLLESCSTNLPVIQKVREDYQKWKINQKEHIFLSDYLQSVIDNFNTIKLYLTELFILPSSLEAFNASETLCLMVFIREIFFELKTTEIKENFAILYYEQLKNLQVKFKLFENNTYFPKKFLQSTEKQLKMITEDDIFNKNMFKIVDKAYKQAIEYLNSFCDVFIEFDCFLWILLRNSQLNYKDIHRTYHIIQSNECDINCDKSRQINEEVKTLNQFLRTISFLDNNLQSKWIEIFRNLDNITIISNIVQYILALPASANLLRKNIENDEITQIITKIKFNLQLTDADLTNINRFFGEHYVRESEKIIEEFKIKQLTD